MSHDSKSGGLIKVSRAWQRAAAAGAGVTLAAAAVVAGAGTAAAKTGPMLAFAPSPFNFGEVAVGHTASQTFTLANSGGKGSGKLSVSLSGSAAFTITGKTCTGKSLGP